MKANIQFGQQEVDNGLTNIVLFDTLTPVLSTLYLDSVASSGKGVSLVGSYDDPYFGPITCRSYLEIGPPGFSTIDNSAVFDSAVLLLVPNRYYYGDTTQAIDIYANRIAHQMMFQVNNSSFFNRDSFPVYPTPLGHVRTTIRPNYLDTVYIPLDSATADSLFTLYRNRDPRLSNLYNFTSYFAGIQLSPGLNKTGTQPIIGFKDSCMVRFWYHNVDINHSKYTISFSYTAKNYQFNEVRNTPPAPLNQFYNGYTTNIQQHFSTDPGFNHIAYVNSLLGYTMKIQFPTLLNLPVYDSAFARILKATLILRPINGSFSMLFPPYPQLEVLSSDYRNVPLNLVSSGAGSLTLDYVGGTTNYAFDVSAYLEAEVTDLTMNVYQRGLIISPAATYSNNTVDRAIFGDKFYPNPQTSANYFQTQLNIYYASVSNNL